MDISSFQSAFKQYTLHERGMRPLSYRSIWSSVEMLCNWAHIADINSFDESVIRAFLYWGRDERLWSARTFRNHRQYLKSFFDWLVKRQVIKRNPVAGIEKPKLPRKIPRCLTREQAQKILHLVRWYPWRYSIETQRNEAILTTFIMTGLRCQELLNLQFADVHLSSGEIMIRQGKGQKDRIVPIHPRLAPILRKYLNQRKRAKPTEWFFTGVISDKPLNGKDVRRICQKISRKSGVYFTPHMLRHTFGRLAVEADLELYKIKEIMGHSAVSTTENYLSVSTENVKRSFGEREIL